MHCDFCFDTRPTSDYPILSGPRHRNALFLSLAKIDKETKKLLGLSECKYIAVALRTTTKNRKREFFAIRQVLVSKRREWCLMLHIPPFGASFS